ncbi:MAG: GTPase Era [Bacilli bacterium]|nr:GTPase Era [Bacilli bacterium]
MRSGTVSIVGRPNVGKSTLLNKILNKKIAIISNKSGTTRNLLLGVYNDDDSQIVFVDTPGIHKPVNTLGTVLNKKAYLMTSGVDVVLFVVDISKGFGKGDSFILERLKNENAKVILLLNKIDNIKPDELIKRIDEVKELYDFLEIIPVSAIKGINVNDLVKTLKKYLPNDFKYYDDNYVTNQPKGMIITERVREKILQLTNEEIPHTVTCVLETYEEKKDLISLGVVIIIDRENVKKIIIGKNGSMLKKIGTEARLDLEEYFNKKVFLSLYVKVIKNWRDKEALIKSLGIEDDIDE